MRLKDEPDRIDQKLEHYNEYYVLSSLIRGVESISNCRPRKRMREVWLNDS